jgi:hypothetical protein
MQVQQIIRRTDTDVLEKSDAITVFLDIDGPLATASCWGMDCDNLWGWYLFDTRCVDVLNKINSQFKIEWVLSSTWRLHGDLDTLNKYFAFRGLDIVLKDTTPIINFSDPKYFFFEGEIGRAQLIREYIVHNFVDKFLVIDDLNMDFEDENMVWIDDDRKGVSADHIVSELFHKLNDLNE